MAGWAEGFRDIMQIVQIVPRIPPALCGVGDHAWLLAKELETNHGIHSGFIFSDPRAPDAANDSPFQSCRITQGDAAAIVRILSDCFPNCDSVVVHLSGYGFATNGAPFWIARALNMLSRLARRPRIVTMFHELFADGPVTSKAFWMKIPQQAAMKRIARMSDHLRTNKQAYAEWLSRSSGRPVSEITAMPVFSSFGESTSPLPPSQRRNQLLLFQPPSYDSPTSRTYWDAWQNVSNCLKPGKTIAAGRSSALPPNANIEVTGVVSAAEAAELFSQSRLVLTDYFDGYLAKSSIFAAAAAHGTNCILAKKNESSSDGLIENEHYCLAGDANHLQDSAGTDRRAASLWSWYQGHSLKATADSYSCQLS